MGPRIGQIFVLPKEMRRKRIHLEKEIGQLDGRKPKEGRGGVSPDPDTCWVDYFFLFLFVLPFEESQNER